MVIPELVQLLGKDNPQSGVTSSFCAQAVAQFGTNAVPFLLPLLESPDLRIRYWTSVAFLRMAEMGESAKKALGNLEKQLNYPDPNVRRIVQLTVKQIQEPKKK